MRSKRSEEMMELLVMMPPILLGTDNLDLEKPAA
jgi:hypothetical protein